MNYHRLSEKLHAASMAIVERMGNEHTSVMRSYVDLDDDEALHGLHVGDLIVIDRAFAESICNDLLKLVP